MPLSPKRKPLESELKGILGDPEDPLNGQKLAKALSNFSKGVLPPTIGIFTGIGPSASAYEAAPPFEKVKGIEDAINTFASFNATGMSPFAFTGIAPPRIFGLQRLFDFVRKNNGTVDDIARLLSNAILVNYTLGRAVFNPLSVTIPTWNIPILPRAVRDELNQDEINAKIAKSAAQEETALEIAEQGQLETNEFLDEMNEPD